MTYTRPDEVHTKAGFSMHERIDANLESILRASGSSLRYFSSPLILANMREAMRKIMSESYIEGSNDTHKAMKDVYVSR